MNYNEVKHKIKKGMLALALAGSLGILAACGKGESGRVDPVKEWVYVPEFVTLEDENMRYYDMRYIGNALYYSSYSWDEATGVGREALYRYSVTDGKSSEVVLDWGEEQEDNNLDDMVLGSDGSMCAVVRSYTYDETTQSGSSRYKLVKFGADGKLMFFQDVTEKLESESRNDWIYIRGIALDDKGRIYLAADSDVFLFDGNGDYKGKASVGNGMDGRMRSIGAGRDGKVYVSIYSYSEDGVSYELTEIDFENRKTGASYGNFPGGNGSDSLTPGAEAGTFIVNDGSTLYEYSVATQTKTALFDWLDSDINGSYVQSVGVMEDGRILAVIYDWDDRENSGIAYLTKTKGSEVAQKETILIGTLYNARELQSAAVSFNRNSEKYHITIKQYMDDSMSYQDAYQDALTNMNNDLTSRANCPDLIDLSGLNIQQLVSKGLLEDLGKYLDKSADLSRGDFVENILNACTYDGVLAGIPSSYELATIIGKPSDVGKEQGWTLQEFIAYADKHPDAALFDRANKEQILYYLIIYNEDAFIDWSRKKCNFDSDEFKALLTFVNRFPDDISNDSRDVSTPTKIQRGEVLLEEVELYNFDEIQMYYEIFGGDITCKGLPTLDGSAGTALACSGMYGITTKATRKEGAWEFLESYLQRDDDRYSFGFPSRKSKLDEMAKKAVTIEYWTDEDGNPVLDENGEPYEIGVGGGISYEDGWSYRYRKATQAEVDLVLQLIDQAKPVNLSSTQILEMIKEDAAGFFEGQKTVDEVVKIIQNRVQLYVDVNG